MARIGLAYQVRIAEAKFLSLPFMLLPLNKTEYLGGLSIKALMNKDLYYYFETLLFKQQLEKVRKPKMPSHVNVIHLTVHKVLNLLECVPGSLLLPHSLASSASLS